MKINEQNGSIFDLDDKYVLVHSASLDCVANNKVSSQIYTTYPKSTYTLVNSIRQDRLRSPLTMFCHSGEIRPMFHLFTRKEYWWKATYKALTDCIQQMARWCVRYEIKYLAMNKLDCYDEDGLKWEKVRKIIEKEFTDLDIEIEIRY